jgi:hypothetical protein
MTVFEQGAGSTRHGTRVAGLNPDPQLVNDVFVRCASHPDYVMRLRYRALSDVNPPFPRTGNLWGWWEWRSKGLPYLELVPKRLLFAGALADATFSTRSMSGLGLLAAGDRVFGLSAPPRYIALERMVR